MRQFIVRLLILTVLATNVAWAMDDCFSPYGSDEPTPVQLGDLPDDSLNDGTCDEFCAGWFHLVAITPGTKLDYYPLTRQGVVRVETSFHSLNQAPPIRPPQI